MEVLCHKPLQDRLIAGMTLLGYIHLSGYSPYQLPESATHREKTVRACLRRWHWAKNTTSPVAKKWYTSQYDRLKAQFPTIEEEIMMSIVSKDADNILQELRSGEQTGEKQAPTASTDVAATPSENQTIAHPPAQGADTDQ